ncbi:MAG TPA: RNA degradosome polyphosphate kinase [Mycobacteriales bacterium]|nr:RNA degradosome polyphosphate kinase [Mycobacteriales bacterium]
MSDAHPGVGVDLPDDRYLNREVSWLRFNARVLELAEDPTTPLLERVKFLAIFASNLDEFFMVRVAGLQRRLATKLGVRSADGLHPREQLELIATYAAPLVERHARCFTDEVAPELAKAGIDLFRWEELDEARRAPLHELFRSKVFPVLTPLALDPSHPFPYISGLSLNLAVLVRDTATGVEHFARVKVPPLLPRFVSVGEDDFLPLEDLIAANLQQLFPGMEIIEHHAFRVTRNADLEVDEDEAEDLLQALERELLRRRFGPAVRLEVEESIAPRVLELLKRELDVNESQVHCVRGLLDLSGLMAIYDLDCPALKDPSFVSTSHPRLVEPDGTAADIFATLREGDILVHHPYDSFTTSVQRFIEQAAADPHVLAIKATLYRTSGDSPIVDALIDAAEAGKQVVALVEIQARFDEQANIRWARALERAGCHVVYGLLGLKTHCKTLLVVRQEKGSLRRYAHIGTGNYNPKTARLYEDVGLLTADERIGADLTDLFNYLTGYSKHTNYDTLIVAPHSVRSSMLRMIDRETTHHEAGRDAHITIKANSIVDEQIVDAIYLASRAGVPVDLVVRGICAVRPGIPGLSETIRVRSILGRFLEHSRIFRFANGGTPEHWLGSADMMHRNLDRRVEVLVRVEDPACGKQLDQILDQALAESTRAWHLESNGEWIRNDAVAGDDTARQDHQAAFIRAGRTRPSSGS